MKDLKELVVEEAVNLKKYATQEEIEKLDFIDLDPDDGTRCIYGQMTGTCFSSRASILLNQCTKPLTNSFFKIEPPRVSEFHPFDRMEYSAIEYYILQPKAKSRILIDFLKGKIETLTPEML